MHGYFGRNTVRRFWLWKPERLLRRCPDVLPAQVQRFGHLKAVVEPPNIAIRIVGAEGEFAAGGLGQFQKSQAGNMVAVADLDGDLCLAAASITFLIRASVQSWSYSAEMESGRKVGFT